MAGSTNLNSIAFFGVDVGSHKITVGKSFCNNRTSARPVTEIVGDTADNRIIPNRMIFPSDETSPRAFGNDVNGTKALNLDSHISSKIEKTYPFVIGKKTVNLPVCVVKNMIMAYIKTVMRMRVAEDGSEAINTVVYVPKYGHMNDLKRHHADAFGIESVIRADASQFVQKSKKDDDDNKTLSMKEVGQKFTDVNLVPISDIHALVMAYVNRHIVDAAPSTSRDVVLVDVGHSKQQVVRFRVSKTADRNIEVEQIGYASKPDVAGEAITKAFCKHIKNRLAKERSGFTVKDVSLVEQVTKLKHQLSSNSVLTPWFQGDASDVTLTVTRSELDDVIRSIGVDKNLVELLECVVLPSRNNSKSKMINLEVVGGCSRTQLIGETVDNFCSSNGVNVIISRTLHPDEAVADGAAFFGWLLNTDSITLKYTRYVRTSVFAHSEITDSKTKSIDRSRPFAMFRVGDRITSIFGRNSKINTDINTETEIKIDCSAGASGPMSDTSFLKLRPDQNVSFYVGNALMLLRPAYPEECKYKDTIEFFYNMIDNVEVKSVKCGGYEVPFKILYCAENCRDSTVDVAKLQQSYSMYESELLSYDADAMRRQYLMNYMEEFFYKKDFINRILKTIQILKNVPQEEYVENVDSVVTWGLRHHIKELYDFYQFCRAYMYDPESAESVGVVGVAESVDSHLKNKHNYILKLLNDRNDVITLTQATCIVSDIIDSYGYAEERTSN